MGAPIPNLGSFNYFGRVLRHIFQCLAVHGSTHLLVHSRLAILWHLKIMHVRLGNELACARLRYLRLRSTIRSGTRVVYMQVRARLALHLVDLRLIRYEHSVVLDVPEVAVLVQLR